MTDFAVAGGRPDPSVRPGLGPQERREPDRGEPADPEEVAAGHAVASGMPGADGDAKHGRILGILREIQSCFVAPRDPA